MKVVLLSQSTFHPHFWEMDAVSRSTWMNHNNENVVALPYYGNSDEQGRKLMFVNVPNNDCRMEHGRLVCDCCDASFHRNGDVRQIKFAMALKWCLSNLEFDYIYRTGCTSYVDIDMMYDFLYTLPRTKVYGGQPHWSHNKKWRFTAGFNTILSRDIVEKIVEDIDCLIKSNNHIEDIAIGKLITYDKKYVAPMEMTHVEIHKCLRELNNNGQDTATGENDIPESNIWNYRFSSYHPKRMMDFHNRYLKYKECLDTKVLYYKMFE